MPIIVATNELPRTVRKSITEKIVSALSNAEGEWKVSLVSDDTNNAWDVETTGPDHFHWERRFSGHDRDADVIAEAIRAAVEASGRDLTPPAPKGVNDALSSLAIQGIAFTSTPDHDGETTYIVDRVKLRESELVYLHKQGALTAHGIRAYLLTRNAA
jgi:hypothetical protein